MSDIASNSSVYRFFEWGDCFIEVREIPLERLGIEERPGMGRAGYREMVIAACCPEFEADVSGTLEAACPENPSQAAEILYELCIEVNPDLDIHRIALPAVPAPALSPTSIQGTAEAGWAAQESPAPTPAPRERAALLHDLGSRCHGIEQRIGRTLMGQPEALAAVARALGKAAVGLAPIGRPLASMLFAGPTGTGKTQLGRCLAEELFGLDEHALVRIDCTEYGEAHDVAKLIGSPPGYVGHEQGGQLIEAVRSRPGSVVVFDEIEKAHSRLHDLLLQILEEGTLTDSRGIRADFSSTVVILTSNAGADECIRAGQTIGFEVPGRKETSALHQSMTTQALARLFRPELLGRLDETVVFRDLAEPDLVRIAGGMLNTIARRLELRGIHVRFTPAVSRWVVRHGRHEDYGARGIRQAVECSLSPRLAELLIGHPQGQPARLRVGVQRGDLTFELEE